MKKYVTDIIGEEYKEWECGSVVTIQAPTGSGKSYFIQNALYDSLGEDERILFLVNRTDLKMQFKIGMCKKLGIEPKNLETRANYGKLTIMSYQTLENNLIMQERNIYKVDLSMYKYIVADEIHYIQSDVNFHGNSVLIYDELFTKEFNNSVRIFISATMEVIEQAIDTINAANRHKYVLEADYSYINPICYKTINDIAMRIKNSEDEKWLVFVTSKKQAETIMNTATNKECKFIYSTTNEEIISYRNEIVNNCGFDCDVLIATKVLENGVNLFMEDLHNIVIMDDDKSTFIQELGRLRIQEDQEVNLYIPCKSKASFTEKRTNPAWVEIEKQLEMYFDLSKRDLFNVLYNGRNIKRLNSQCFYLDTNGEIQLNIVGYAKFIYDVKFVEDMIKIYETGNNGSLNKFEYPMVVCSWLNVDSYGLFENIIENEVDEVVSIELEELLRNAYDGDERFTKEYFIETIDNIIKKDKDLQIIMNRLDGGNGRKKGMKIYNKLFKELNYDYLVGSKKFRENGKLVTKWIIVKEN